jgi:hypothetical protein
MLHAVAGLFAEISDKMADRTVEVARSWRSLAEDLLRIL